ncbi:MAG: LptF/LptG family permease [Pseudomonadota bacterium]
MASTFGRYVFRQAFSTLVLVLFSLISFVWIGLALQQLKIVTANGQDVVTLVAMTTLAVPKLLAVIAPLALLIAAVHVLNRLNSDSELIVVTASGAPIWTVARPLLTLGLLVALLALLINHAIMPWSLRELRYKITQVRTDLITQVLQPGKFLSPEVNVVAHIRSRGLDGTLYGLLMHDARKPIEISYLAEKARVVKVDQSAYLAMEQGHIVRGPLGITPQEILRFDNYAIDLDRFERKQAAHVWKPQERYFHELLVVDETAREGGYQERHFNAEFHERFSNALYPFLFVLVAIAFVGQAQSTRQNRNQNLAMTFVIAIAFRLGGLALNNAVVINPLLFPLMYVLPISGIIMMLAMIATNARQRPGLSMSDRIEIAIGDIIIYLKSLFKRRRNSEATSLQPGE